MFFSVCLLVNPDISAIGQPELVSLEFGANLGHFSTHGKVWTCPRVGSREAIVGD